MNCFTCFKKIIRLLCIDIFVLRRSCLCLYILKKGDMGEQLKAVELPKRTSSKITKRTLRSIESS